MSLLPKNQDFALSPGDSQPFDRFWAAWPRHSRKTAKAKCKAKWQRENLDAKIDHVLTVIKAWKVKWALDNNKFVPAPIVWLNGERWDCEIEDLPGAKRDRKCHPIAKGIAKSGDVRYGPHAKRAHELMMADAPYIRNRKLREIQERTGNTKMTVWRAYVWLAEHETAQE